MNNYGNMMIGDQFRKIDSNYSPKSSPHGGRSPVVSRQDSSGTLKTTISLGKTPTIIHTGPFYSMKEPPGKGELTGDKDLMTEYGLHHTLTKFKDKKVKESLASFLPNLPGIYDGMSSVENSTLRSVIEKPPIGGKELLPLNSVQLAGFRLHPGPLPEQYRALNATPARKHKNKHKKHKHKDGAVPPETNLMDSAGLETYEKKHKKQKRHEDEKERKKRKKEKKRKKKSHSPEPGAGGGGGAGGGVGGTGPAGVAGMTSMSGAGGVVGGGSSLAGSMTNAQLQQQQQMPITPALQQQHQQQQQQTSAQQQQHSQQQSQQMLSAAALLGAGGGGPGGLAVLGGIGLSAVSGNGGVSGMGSGGISGSALMSGSGPGSGSGSGAGPGGLMLSQQQQQTPLF